MGDKFDQALVYVVRQLGQVNVTKLEKILYLADLEHFHRTGTTLTGARWVRFKLGPLAYRLDHSRRELNRHEVEVSTEPQGDREANVFRPGSDPRFDPNLTKDDLRDLDTILRITLNLDAEEMIALAYNTTPMRFLLSKEGGTPRYRVGIPFDLTFEVRAQTAGETPTASPEERVDFKLREVARIADLQEATLSRVVGSG
jgi:hypothetical protein